MIHKKNVKVPLKLIHLVSRCNGLAAGNTIEEAIMHASCEIFERYALINVIKPEKIVPTIDIDSINSPVIEKLVDLFNKNNIDITIKDISFNGLLPCISILFTNKNLPSNHVEHRILQPGASFNQEEALIRCFTERMLGRLNIHRPVINKTISNKIKNYEKLSTSIISFKDISFLNEGEVTYLPKKNRLKDIFEELEQIKNICKKIGTDCIIVNLTHPILKFPVVRVIMPGISDKLSYLMPAKEFLEKINKIMQSFF
ncbi:MAG: YcaO-like family protein [Nanoarchaeota archaeon]|nr:YcaO-like family protein [Nanoarchaeota archaeon]